MNFVNNWQRPIVLAVDVLACALDLPDGVYRLTLADAAQGASRWEIVSATVAGGAAVLGRAQEGTAAQAWPAGSVIYAALTAGVLAALAGGAQVITGPGVPDAAPPAAGALYLAPMGSAFLAMGAQHPEEWVRLSGAVEGYGFGAAPVDIPFTLPRSVRGIQVSAAPPANASCVQTLRLPAWPVLPRDFFIKILGSVAAPITLHLDFAGALPAGVGLSSVGVIDYASGATISRVGNVLSIVSAYAVRVYLADLALSPPTASAGVELARLPYAAVTSWDM